MKTRDIPLFHGASLETIKRISRATGEDITISKGRVKKLRKKNKRMEMIARKTKELGY